MKRGDIYVADLGEPQGHEQGYRRPVILVSATPMLAFGLPIVIPLTRTKRGYPTHVEIENAELPVTSYAQCEQIRVITAGRLSTRLGAVDPVDMARIDRILHRILALGSTPVTTNTPEPTAADAP